METIAIKKRKGKMLVFPFRHFKGDNTIKQRQFYFLELSLMIIINTNIITKETK